MKRYTFEGNNGGFTGRLADLDALIALARESQRQDLPFRLYTSDAEGDIVNGCRIWHDGFTESERETLHEAGVEW